MDGSINCDIIRYSSSKSRRILRSASPAKLFLLANVFDIASTMRLPVNDISDSQVPSKLFTESRSLYVGIVALNLTTEKRLIINLCLLRQSYERWETAKVSWIQNTENRANELRKKSIRQGCITNPLTIVWILTATVESSDQCIMSETLMQFRKRRVSFHNVKIHVWVHYRW